MGISDIRKAQILEAWNKTHDISQYIKKSIQVQVYSNRKVNLTYEKLKNPKAFYYAHVMQEGKEYLREIPKTVYDALDIQEDLSDLGRRLKPSDAAMDIYQRFGGKDYMHMNFLSAAEKRRITKTKLWIEGKYKDMLKVD